jgi:methylase of polypeptide subunit release factors
LVQARAPPTQYSHYKQAIVLAKALHYLSDEGVFPLKDKRILELGSGVGFLGIYLACLGNNVIMGDVPSIRDLTERNIGLNKGVIKGKIDFVTANWYCSVLIRKH